MAYGIDSLTNGTIGDVSVTINGGTVKSTYRAIRQFLNSTTDMNTLVINGGTVVGDNKAVFVHSPSAKSNVGAITVEDTATLTGGVYLFATAGATEYLVDVSIAVEAVGEGTVTTKNFPENYSLKTVDGNYIVKEGNYVAEVNGEKYETLAQAISAAVSGDIVTITKEGAYKLPSFRKDITIKAVDNVTIDNGGAVALHGANVTFENIIFDYYPNVNYTGLQHIATAQYNNCTFNGQVFLYGSSEIFNNCTFNQNSPDAYNVWTYGAATVEFNSCTFNSAGKCVLVYNEGACATSFTAEECTFNASQAVEGKSAVEIDTTLMPDGTEIIINNSTAAGFAPGSVSGNTLWNDKKNQTDLTIKVNDIKVWPAVVKIAEADGSYTYYETLQEAVAAIDSNDDKIYLINDIEVDEVIRLEGKFKVQIYGEGHTVTGSAKKVFEVYTPSATFNNITIVNTAYQGRCIDTRVDNTYVTVRESELKVTNKNTQPITIGGSNTNDNKMVHLNVYNSTITADNGGYAIIVFQPADIAITASNVTGYSALYMKDGSAGSIVNIGGKSVLTGNNEANSYTNAFGTVVFETEGITMNVNQYPTLIANNTGDQSQSIFELKGNANTITMNGKVELNGKNTFILSNLVYDEQTPVTVSDSLVELVEAEGYIVEGNIVKGVNMLSFVDESVMIRNLKKRSVLVLSSYTENGKLIDVKLVDITSDGYTAMSDTGLNTNAHVIKAALWDSVANMTPLCPAIIK